MCYSRVFLDEKQCLLLELQNQFSVGCEAVLAKLLIAREYQKAYPS
jgi:hypothetical protein